MTPRLTRSFARLWTGLACAAALVCAVAPARAQTDSPAEQAVTLIEQGKPDEARAVIQAAATQAASTRAFPEWFEAGTFFLDLNSVMAGAMLEGRLGPVLTFSDMAFAAVADTPLATHPTFIEFSNYRSRLCAVTGDVDCIVQGSAAAFAQMKGPTGDYEKSAEREATQWRAMAHVLRGERPPATRLLRVLASAVGKPDPAGLASELEGLANLQQSIAPPIEQAMLREAIAVLEQASGRDHRFLENRLNGNLGVSYQNSGMLAEAEAAYRAAWRISEREFSPDSVGAISDSDRLARVLAEQGRWDEALPLYRRNWDIADAYRDWSLDLDDEVGGWIFALLNTGQIGEADRVSERVLREVRATRNVDGNDLSNYLNLRALVLIERDRPAEAEPLLREAVTANSQNDLSGGATLIANLAAVIEAQGRFAEAEPLRRQAYDAVRKNVVFSAFGSQRIDAGVALATNLSRQGKTDEADALFADMMALAQGRADPAGYAVRTVASAQGRHLLDRGMAGEATELARLALQLSADALGLLGPGTGEAAYLAAARQQREAALLLIEARLAAGPIDEAGLAELFAAGQRAQASSAASAMALNAAQALAARAGAGEAVAKWQQAQAEVTALDRRIAALGGQGAAGDRARRPLFDQRDAALRLVQERERALLERFPRFFDLARPSPAALAETRAMLAPDEVLVLLVPGAGERFGGMALALARDGGAAAPIALAPAELRKLVDQLHTGLAARDSGFTDAADFDAPQVIYDREAALALYRALFGAPPVAAVLADRRRWTLAPQQGLIGVAFDALVTAPPPGGPAGDTDPAHLRATAWLGIERALAVTPSASALTLARTASGEQRSPTDPFFGLGDPAFKGAADPPVVIPEEMRDRGSAVATRAPDASAAYYRGPVADLAAIARLQRLPGTAVEIATLARLLGAGQGATLTQLDATEAALRAREASGQLGAAGLVVMATHGLIAGELKGAAAAEPALALTPPPGVAQDALTPDNDGLLTATEAAGLSLAAEWVILSACNTSAADGRDPDGLSGLARGFFYAGARSLLVSHFPVSDRATPLLTAAAVAARRDQGLDRAEAMRAARRALLADTAFDADGMSLAHPKAWAALALVDPGADPRTDPRS